MQAPLLARPSGDRNNAAPAPGLVIRHAGGGTQRDCHAEVAFLERVDRRSLGQCGADGLAPEEDVQHDRPDDRSHDHQPNRNEDVHERSDAAVSKTVYGSLGSSRFKSLPPLHEPLRGLGFKTEGGAPQAALSHICTRIRQSLTDGPVLRPLRRNDRRKDEIRP